MKVKEKVITLRMASGSNFASFRTALDNGFIIGAEVHTNHTDIDNLAEIELADDNSVGIARKSHVNHWKRREGSGFSDSFKPLNIDTQSRTFEFKAFTEQNVVKNTFFQIILIYKQ